MDTPDEVRSSAPQTKIKYEKPVLVVVGNLRDLLAGNGSAFNDNTLCDSGGGTFNNC